MWSLELNGIDTEKAAMRVDRPAQASFSQLSALDARKREPFTRMTKRAVQRYEILKRLSRAF